MILLGWLLRTREQPRVVHFHVKALTFDCDKSGLRLCSVMFCRQMGGQGLFCLSSLTPILFDPKSDG